MYPTGYCWPYYAYSIHQELSLSPLWRLFQGQLMLSIIGLPVSIPSTRNNIFLPWLCWVLLAFPDSSIHQESSLACIWCQEHVGGCWLHLYYSIHHDSLLSLTARLHQDHWFVGCCWPPSDYSIPQESLSPQWPPQLSKDHVWCHWCPSAYPSTMNHLSLLYGTFNMATITLGVVDHPLTIPSTRNLIHDILNRVRMIFGNVFLLKSLSPRNHLLILHGHWNFLHPAGKFFLSYHSFSMVFKLETCIVSLSL